MYNISQKDSVQDTLEIYNNLYNILFSNSNRNTKTPETQKSWVEFQKKYVDLPPNVSIHLFRCIAPTTKDDLQDFFETEIAFRFAEDLDNFTPSAKISEQLMCGGTAHLFRSANRNICSEISDEAWDEFTEKIILPFESRWIQYNKMKIPARKTTIKRWLDRVKENYPGTIETNSVGSRFTNWSFYISYIQKKLKDKLRILGGLSSIKLHLFSIKSREDYRIEIENNNGIVCVDLASFPDGIYQKILVKPEEARDSIKDILMNEVIINEELGKRIVVQFCDLDVESDTFADIRGNKEKNLFTFKGQVKFTSEPQIKNGHDFVNVIVLSGVPNTPLSLCSFRASAYFKPYFLEEIQSHDGFFDITAIRTIKTVKEKERYQLEIVSLKVPVEIPFEPDSEAVQRYQKLIEEKGSKYAFDTFITNFSSLDKRDLMVKCCLLSAVSSFGKNHTRTNPQPASNCLVIGDPDLGKSQTLDDFQNKIGEINKVDCIGTSDNFISRYEKDPKTGLQQLFRGPFARVKGKITISDEMQRLSEKAINDTLTICSSGHINISKGGLDRIWDITRPWITFCNPNGNKRDINGSTKFDLSNPDLKDQFPENISDNLLSRFDQVLCQTDGDLTRSEKKELLTNIFLGKKKKINDDLLSDHEIKSIFWYAKNLDVVHLDKTKKDWVKFLETTHLDKPRKIQGLVRIAESFARFEFCKVVKFEHYSKAYEHLLDVYDTWVYTKPSPFIDRGDK